jgi:hypothetical protein
MSDIYDVIQAFADGEPVDPVELEHALADPDGRAHLIDVVVLRKLVKRSSVAVPVAAAESSREPRRPLRWLAAAAAIVTIASVGGYFVGERFSMGRQVAGTATADVAPADSTTAAAPPPAPTLVITFKPGVDWTERGGH